MVSDHNIEFWSRILPQIPKSHRFDTHFAHLWDMGFGRGRGLGMVGLTLRTTKQCYPTIILGFGVVYCPKSPILKVRDLTQIWHKFDTILEKGPLIAWVTWHLQIHLRNQSLPENYEYIPQVDIRVPNYTKYGVWFLREAVFLNPKFDVTCEFTNDPGKRNFSPYVIFGKQLLVLEWDILRRNTTCLKLVGGRFLMNDMAGKLNVYNFSTVRNRMKEHTVVLKFHSTVLGIIIAGKKVAVLA